ncbi:MAG: S-methyl-5'-thioadenosine phosphorylase [archaeon GB-1867-035]|nr:S-methyl-5'-thioadenosine phosphorylase [Candidatus Culexmicrobium profundum]
MTKIAIIGGSGLENALEIIRTEVINTPYGQVEVNYSFLNDKKVIFLPRHGKKHERPPHMINYKGNIWALKELGVERIIASNAVGGIRDGLKPGDFVVIHDFIDFTRRRPLTFYDGPKVIHIDVTEPYCPEIRSALINAARELSVKVWESGVYACMEGPRFETPAEIRMLRLLGADVVGMTSVPEVVLARELGMCYASLCIVTNYAAGIQERISAEEVSEIMKIKVPVVLEIFKLAVKKLPEKRNCKCMII